MRTRPVDPIRDGRKLRRNVIFFFFEKRFSSRLDLVLYNIILYTPSPNPPQTSVGAYLRGRVPAANSGYSEYDYLP